MNHTNQQNSKSTLSSKFANPKLAEIADSFQVKSTRSYAKSIGCEISAWFFLPIGLIVFGLNNFLRVLTFSIILIFFRMVLPDNISQLISTLYVVCYYYLAYLYIMRNFFRLRRTAKRHRIDALKTLSRKSQDPVLYLRSFMEEEKINSERLNQKTHEEDLVLSLSTIGPVIAIGNPKDDIAPLGATRIYLKNENWQENVKQLMKISQLILIHPGISEGVLWELETAIENINSTKVIMSFLSWMHLDENDRQSEYRQFKLQFEKFMNQSESPVTITLPESIGNASFLVFSDDWIPELIEIDKWKKRFYKFSNPLIVNETLRPFLKNLNLKLSWRKNVPYIIFIIWLAFGLSWNLVWTILWFVDFNNAENTPLEWLIDISALVACFLIAGWVIPNTILFLSNKIMYLFPSRGSGLQETGGFNSID